MFSLPIRLSAFPGGTWRATGLLLLGSRFNLGCRFLQQIPPLVGQQRPQLESRVGRVSPAAVGFLPVPEAPAGCREMQSLGLHWMHSWICIRRPGSLMKQLLCSARPLLLGGGAESVGRTSLPNLSPTSCNPASSAEKRDTQGSSMFWCSHSLIHFVGWPGHHAMAGLPRCPPQVNFAHRIPGRQWETHPPCMVERRGGKPASAWGWVQIEFLQGNEAESHCSDYPFVSPFIR